MFLFSAVLAASVCTLLLLETFRNIVTPSVKNGICTFVFNFAYIPFGSTQE